MAKTQKKDGTQQKKQDDAIELLKQDHRKVEQLFKQFEELKEEDEEATAEIVEAACAELQIHDKIETEIFYPAVREQAEDE
jgi:hemerythrin superfamily protein